VRPSGPHVITTDYIHRLVAEARTNNPSLKAADSRVRSATLNAQGIRTWEDPMAMFGGVNVADGQVVARGNFPIGGEVEEISSSGALGENVFSSWPFVDVGTVKFDLDMNMPGMVMHSGSTMKPTGTPGQYRVEVKPDMAGDWMATLRYEGPRGSGSVSFSVNVKP